MPADYSYLTNTGVISVESQSLLTDVQNEWKSTLGQDLDVDAKTPQGTLITSEAIARTSVMKNNADVANSLNPNMSDGTQLDAVCAFLGEERGKDGSTVVTGVVITGTSDPITIVQSGLRVQTSAGDIFVTQGTTQILPNTTNTITIASQQPGPVPAALGVLKIIDGVIGWGSAEIVATSSVNLGELKLSDTQLRTRRNQRLFALGITACGAIKAKALGVKNVNSAQVIENLTGSASGVVNGVTFTIAGSNWVCVSGGTDTEVAQALHDAHSTGTPWDYGATGMGVQVQPPNGVPVVDKYTKLPYRVKFTRPVAKDAYVSMTYQQGTSTATEAAIIQTIKDFADGKVEGEDGFIVGQSVSAFEVSGAVAKTYPGLYIKECKVAVVASGSAVPAPGAYVYEVVLKPYEQANLALGAITVKKV